MSDAKLLERMKSKVIKTPAGCWRWGGHLDRDGYGRIQVEGRDHLAHRAILRAIGRELPAGLEVDHLCRVRACVNPSHLDVVTRRVNTLRSNSVSALNARKTKCVNGHEFTPENTSVRPNRDGFVRSCRTCRRASTARYAAKKRAAASSVPATESGQA